MEQNINLNLLKYFYEVVNCNNITKASQELLVSQPAITKAIKELESELDVKLLERNKKGVVPTVEGEILYNNIKDMFKSLNTTLNVIETNKYMGGNVYIGASTTNFMNLIMDTLKEFKKIYPNVHINIVLEDIKVLTDMAKLGKLDILIKNSYEDMDDFCNIKSFEIMDRFIASSEYFPELMGKVLSLDELLQYPFVLLSNITHGRKNFDNYLKSQGITFKPTYEFNSYSLCRELIRNGFGIGVGNPIHYSDDEHFVIVETDFSLPVRKFDIGYIKTSKNRLIKEFIELLKK